MRSRDRVLQSLESVYRDAFDAAKERDDQSEMARLEVEYQRDQLHLEVMMDIRDLLSASQEEEEEDKGPSLIERAQQLRKITRLRP